MIYWNTPLTFLKFIKNSPSNQYILKFKKSKIKIKKKLLLFQKPGKQGIFRDKALAIQKDQ